MLKISSLNLELLKISFEKNFTVISRWFLWYGWRMRSPSPRPPPETVSTLTFCHSERSEESIVPVESPAWSRLIMFISLQRGFSGDVDAWFKRAVREQVRLNTSKNGSFASLRMTKARFGLPRRLPWVLRTDPSLRSGWQKLVLDLLKDFREF